MKDLEVVGSRAFFRPRGNFTFEQGVDLVAKAMQQARALDVTELVVNTIDLTGFEPLTVFRRYTMAMRWVESAGAAMRVAWVAKPEHIDSEKIMMVVAQNRGAAGDVFPAEQDALAWLDARRPTRDRLAPSGGAPSTDRT